MAETPLASSSSSSVPEDPAPGPVAMFAPPSSVQSRDGSPVSGNKRISLEEALFRWRTQRKRIPRELLENDETTAQWLNLFIQNEENATAYHELRRDVQAQTRRGFSWRAIQWSFAVGLVIGLVVMMYISPPALLRFSSSSALSSGGTNYCVDHMSRVPAFAWMDAERTAVASPPDYVLPLQKGPSSLFMVQGKRCVPLNTSSDAVEEIRELHHSLQHHLSAQQLVGLSAFRVGRPQCYLLLRDVGGRPMLAMANPQVIQVNKELIRSISEPSDYCPNREAGGGVTRTLQLWVSYLDPYQEWQRMERRLDGQQAWAFQIEFALLHGKVTCDQSDRGLETLLQLSRSTLE